LFNSNIVDVAIGLVFIFLLLSLICSAAHEIIEAFLKQRAANLERGIQELAGDNSQAFVTRLYDHGLINSLYKGTYAPAAKGFFKRLWQRMGKGPDLPSYIPSKNFALALIDLKNTGANLPQNIRDALQAFERVAGQDVAQLQQQIEDWYNSAMDRVSGWYKRRSQFIVLFLGLAATVAVNADCIDIAKRLSTNSSFRQSVEQMADATLKNMAAPNTGQTAGQPDAKQQATVAFENMKANLHTLDAIGLPLGRDYSLKRPGELWTATRVHWIGWLITALAVSLGAPFWFDILNKIMVVRATVKPSEKSGAEGSKDARPTAPPPPPDTAAQEGQGAATAPGDGG
jgi:hypothetical protein